MQLTPAFVAEPCGGEALSVRFSPDSAFLAVASTQGQVSVHNVSTGKEAYRLNLNEAHPVKQVCWRPEADDASTRTRGVLVGASTDGQLRQWHTGTSKCIAELGDPKNGQLFCVDYRPDGARLATGGLESLWVFDEETKKEVVHLQGGDYNTTTGHSNRVFSAKWAPAAAQDPNVLISGGWDSSVQFWDVRVGHAVRAIYGPHVCGDSVDISADGRAILTGSWRDENQLELWDFGTGKRTEVMPWRRGGLADPRCFLYTARFSHDQSSSFVVAGGSFAGEGGGEAKVLSRAANGVAEDGAAPCCCAGTLVGFTCLSADFSRAATGTDPLVALGGTDGRVCVFRAFGGAGPGQGAASEVADFQEGREAQGE